MISILPPLISHYIKRDFYSCDDIQTLKILQIMEDRITEINIKDLPLLRDLYAPDDTGYTKSHSAFVTIDIYIRWIQQDPNVKHVQFFCLNDNFSSGTFVAVVSFILF